MSEYSEAADEARAAIEDAGAPMILSLTIPGIRDRVAGTALPDTQISKNIHGLIEDAQAAAKYFVGSTIQTGDMKITIPYYADVELDLAYRPTLIIDGVKWLIKTVGKIAPGGVTIMFPLHVSN